VLKKSRRDSSDHFPVVFLAIVALLFSALVCALAIYSP
jgi:hypothetical protein